MDVYNKNRDQNNSIHDEIKEQNAKLKNASLKKKLGYFKDYYLKMTLAIAAGVILIVSMIVTMVTAPDDTGFAAFFFNNNEFITETPMLDEFVTYAAIDTKEHDAYIDSSLYYDSEINSQDIYATLEKSIAVISTNELDIVVGDEEAVEYFCQIEACADVTALLPADLMEQFQDKLYYSTNLETGETLPLGLYVADSPKLAEYGYYKGQEPILCFIANSNSIENAITFLRYLYTE